MDFNSAPGSVFIIGKWKEKDSYAKYDEYIIRKFFIHGRVWKQCTMSYTKDITLRDVSFLWSVYGRGRRERSP